MTKDYWFTEKTLPGEKGDNKFSLKVKKKTFFLKSPYQKIEIFDTSFYGRMLVLDGIVQLTERDEFIYHEMMANLPLFSHPNPKKVLIIGGGDGGTLREVLKHPAEKIDLVEIDKKVIEISKKYLPFVSKGAFRDKRAKIFIEDGIKFVKKCKPNSFDVIIIDSTDPSGLSALLFSIKFYQNIYNILNKNGIMITQSGTFLEQLFQVKKIFNNLKNVFPYVKVYRACVPCYGTGEYSFTIASKINLEKINFQKIKKRYKKLKLKTKYYSPEIHSASGILPKYLK